MTIFSIDYYNARDKDACNIAGYKQALESVLQQCVSETEKEESLREEAIEITNHIISGIHDVIKKDRKIHDLVWNKGAIPLATWTDYLNMLSQDSLVKLKYKIDDMQRELERGKIGGFPGTMFLYNKPTFVTLEAFYNVVFDLAGIKR